MKETTADIIECLKRTAGVRIDTDAQTMALAAEEIERLQRLWSMAVRDMESCACEWALDKNSERTDKIETLCAAHEELFARRTEQLTHERDEARAQRGTLIAEGNCIDPVKWTPLGEQINRLESECMRLRAALERVLNYWRERYHQAFVLADEVLIGEIRKIEEALLPVMTERVQGVDCYWCEDGTPHTHVSPAPSSDLTAPEQSSRNTRRKNRMKPG